MKSVKDLKPERVFYYFDKISEIPRGSGNTKAISDFLVNFAKEHNLKYIQEEIGNVIIFKAAAKGYEQADSVILQGHMDMVCEKNADSDHDFLKDRIKLVVEGDYVMADNTTLGADDGIALAYALAVLEDEKLLHPRIEAVFTVDEEVGMEGAIALDATKLEGKKILNIDSEEEGILWASCAGGLRCDVNLPLKYEKIKQNCRAFTINITGLKGGHSGTEINRGRVNANCLLGQILSMLQKNIKYSISNIGGGMKDNAIPRESFATVIVDEALENEIEKEFNNIVDFIKTEHSSREPRLNIKISKEDIPAESFDETTTKKCVLLLNALPNGVVNMSADIENLVETSLNIGVIKTDREYFSLAVSIRSSVSAAKEILKEKVIYISESIGGRCKAFGDYPAWEFRKESKLRDIFTDAYERLFGGKMEILALHAGLECGILTDKLKSADCVSFGPDIIDIHTPKEKMSISSVERTYKLLLEVLKQLN